VCWQERLAYANGWESKRVLVWSQRLKQMSLIQRFEGGILDYYYTVELFLNPSPWVLGYDGAIVDSTYGHNLMALSGNTGARRTPALRHRPGRVGPARMAQAEETSSAYKAFSTN
jgi:hypothetical protein